MLNLTPGERAEMNRTAEETFDKVRANTHCTIYNKYTQSRAEHYQRTQIPNVDWEDRKAVNVVASGGSLAANQAEIVIPFSRTGYLQPKAWQALVDKSENWTLQVGDVIVKGLVEDEIAETSTISDLHRNYDDVLTITSIDTIDGSVAFKHWKVGAQ